ncbi:NAD-dependent epimerase/dehydratase [Candidatus Omnitrophus magneticus]|uniref:NAD-dependent epimerase/dehydratase n=1 Tax=Candidatus Omnitrophus magneticus TaxID=1609969 RepID=A0A0F0CV89_9BACT|nr:NAD-dependent epimerase/dehydratase [Candidatus Omnitrophus magneticus]
MKKYTTVLIKILLYYAKLSNVTAINPSFLYGVRDSRPTPSGEMIIKILNRVYPCYFDATVCVSSLDMTVSAHLKAMEKGASGERYIVTQKESYTLKEIFDMLEDISGIPGPRIKLPIEALYGVSVLNELALAHLPLFA